MNTRKKEGKMNAIFKGILLVVAWFVFNVSASAQEPCDPFDPQPGCDDYNPDVPLDGGTSLLIAAGVAYGLKRYRDSRKSDGENTIE